MTCPTDEERLYDIEGAAAYLRISERQLWRLISRDDIDLQLYRIEGMSRNHRRLKQSELLALLVPTTGETNR